MPYKSIGQTLELHEKIQDFPAALEALSDRLSRAKGPSLM
jgi:hypothetical protein